MKKIILSTVFICLTHFGFAQNDAFKKDALQLTEIAGGMDAQLSLMEEQLKPNVPQDQLTLIMTDIKKELPALNNKIADTYMKHYSHEDIKELLAFYKTPLGQKLLKKTQEITPDVMSIHQEWYTESIQGIIMKHMQ